MLSNRSGLGGGGGGGIRGGEEIDVTPNGPPHHTPPAPPNFSKPQQTRTVDQSRDLLAVHSTHLLVRESTHTVEIHDLSSGGVSRRMRVPGFVVAASVSLSGEDMCVAWCNLRGNAGGESVREIMCMGSVYGFAPPHTSPNCMCVPTRTFIVQPRPG